MFLCGVVTGTAWNQLGADIDGEVTLNNVSSSLLISSHVHNRANYHILAGLHPRMHHLFLSLAGPCPCHLMAALSQVMIDPTLHLTVVGCAGCPLSVLTPSPDIARVHHYHGSRGSQKWR